MRSACQGRLLVVATTVAIGGCISSDSQITDVGDGCTEFALGRAVDTSRVDRDVQQLMAAAADLGQVAREVREEVRDACGNLARDLGAKDSWSAIDDPQRAIHNRDATGACDAAKARLTAVLRSAADAGTELALVVSEGRCHLDFAAQTRCDRKCERRSACRPGKVEQRCKPAALSVKCHGSCKTGAYCEGTTSVAASCTGSCRATCIGRCAGKCIGEDGRVTKSDESCRGKCTARCDGKCTGLCRIEASAGVRCGAEVRCRGGCSASFAEPVCETLFSPPDCTLDERCHQACSARVAAHPVCEPPRVELLVRNATPEVNRLVDSVEKNLPSLVAAAKREGRLAKDALARLSRAAESLSKNVGDLDGHSLSCTAVSAKATLDASAWLAVSIQGSVAVTGELEAHTE